MAILVEYVSTYRYWNYIHINEPGSFISVRLGYSTK